MLVKRMYFVSLFCCAAVLSLNAQIKGEVFFDKNKNGIREKNEPGIAAVAVTDGQHVVKTDKNGCFNLPGYDNTRFITLTVPDGYRASVNHYLPYQENSPNNYAFGLVKSGITSKNGFSFIQITDTETYNYRSWVNNLKDYVKANPVAFIVHTGDICYQRGLNFHGKHLQSKDMGTQMFYCVGNHDLVQGKYGEELWQKNFGPSWYSFEVGNFHFIVTPMLGGDYAPSYSRQELLNWMKSDLAQVEKGKQVVLFNHDLWFWGDDFVFKTKGGDQIDFADHGLKAIVYGHWHISYCKRFPSGVGTYSSSTPDKGGIDHGASSFRLFHAGKNGELSSEIRYTFMKNHLEAVFPVDGECVTAKDGYLTVRVNTYRTESVARRVRVAVSKDGKIGGWRELKPDTDWAWSGRMKVGGGKQMLMVEADYNDGVKLSKRVTFVVDDEERKIVPGGNWANLQGDEAHNRRITGGVDLPLRVNWVNNVKGNVFMSSPVVAEGKVFVGTIDNGMAENCFVVANDLVSGDEVWRFQTGNSVNNTIVYMDSLVIAADAEGVVYGIQARTGKERWRRKLKIDVLPALIQGCVAADGVVYAGQGKGITAIQVSDGGVLWENQEWRGGEGTTSTMTVGDGVLVASAHWNGLYAHDLKTGKLRWKKQDGNIRFRDGSPVFYDGNFYLASTAGLFLINPRSGEILKSVEGDYSFNAACAPVVTDKLVIVATAGKGVMAFDRLSFKEVWTYRTDPALFYTVPYSQDQVCSVEVSPTLIDGTLLFGASDGYLHAVDVNTGEFQWKRVVGAPVFTSMAASGNSLFLADFSGNLYHFGMKK